MGTIGWLAFIAVGIALGIGIGRALPVRTAKMAELEREKEQARDELGKYREEVSAHFERTAALFDKVTADYRNLYEHLAVSARQLGAIEGESSEQALKEPEQRRLASAETAERPDEADMPDTADTTEEPADPSARRGDS